MKFRCEQCNAQYMIADEKVGHKGVRVRCKKCGTIITVRPSGADAGPGPDTETGEPPAEREQTAVNQDPAPEEPAGPDRTTVDSQPPDEDGAASGRGDLDIGEEDVGSAFDSLLGENGHDEQEAEDAFDQDEPPDEFDRQSTRVFSYEEMQRVQEEKEQAAQEREQFADIYSAAKADEEQQALGAQDGAAPAGDVDRDRVEWYAAVDEQQVGPMSINDIADRWERGEFDPETLVWKTGFEDWLIIQEVPVLQFLLASPEEPAAEEEAPLEDEPAEEAPGSWEAGPAEGAGGEFDDEDEALGRVFDEAMGGGEQPAADEEEDLEDTSGMDGYSGFDEDEQDEDDRDEDEDLYADDAPASASAEAFAADVDWKPSAISSLNSLAEEELASLKPPPEPEVEDETPFGDDMGLPGEDEEEGVEMEDGDSSIIGQIAAEEEAAARRAEDERLAEERRAEEARRKEEEEALAAQEAARRELEEEQREKAAPPPEKVIPTRTGLPKWVWGAIGACVVVIVALSVVIAYKFGMESSTQEPATTVAGGNDGMQPMKPPADKPAATASTEPVSAPEPAAGAATGSAAASESAGKEADNGDEAGKAGTGQGGAEPEKTKPEPKRDRQPAARPAPDRRPKPPPARRRKHRRRRAPREERKEVARRDEPPPPPSPPPEEKKPKRRKPKGGILDFEDAQAFADVTGSKPVAPRPKPEPVKKELPPLSNADVLAVMRKHLAEFKACNRKQKEIDSSVRGRLVVDFIINPNGRVARVNVTTAQFKSTFVSKCIARVIKQLRFPEFGGGPKKVPFPFTVQ